MSIIIKGMEMPRDGRKHTAVLQFLEDGKCRAIVEYSKSYDDRSVKVFEAVPIPEWHGRLGDLDKINASLEAMIEIEHNQSAAPCSWAHAPELEPLPTVLEAYCDDFERFRGVRSGVGVVEPTHWMPMPEPPKEGGSDG